MTTLVTQMPPSPPIKDLLDQGLRALDAQKHARYLAAKGLPPDAPEPPRTGLYVSEVRKVVGDSACWRDLWFSFHGAPRDQLATEQLLAFQVGDRIEQLYVDALSVTGELARIQVPTPFAGIPISGRLDVLLRRDRRVVELKSVTVKQWNKLPKQEHLDQTLIYVHGLRLLPDYADVPGGVAVYIAKDAPKGHEGVLEVPVPYDEQRARDLLDTFQFAWAAAAGDTRPQRPTGYIPNEWPCGYCAFRTHCWSGADG